MITFLFFRFLLSIITGYMVVNLFWPRSDMELSRGWIKLPVAIGIGFGICSLLFSLCTMVAGPDKGFFFATILEIFLFFTLILTSLFLYPVSFSRNFSFSLKSSIPSNKIYKIVSGFFWVNLCIFVFSFVAVSISKPHGQWDAWAIWNMHARFLFRGGLYWTNLFSDGIAWSHGDYPLLLPAIVANSWKWIGGESVVVPIAVAMFFALSTIWMLVSGLALIKTKMAGLLGGLLLMGTSVFVKEGVGQCADIPLAFFFISTLVLFCLIDLNYEQNKKMLPLVGFISTLAAWTKNEGILFVLIVLIARGGNVLYSQGLKIYIKEVLLWGAGAMPVVLTNACFKIFFAPPSDLFLEGFSGLIKVTDFSRYQLIAYKFWQESIHFGQFRYRSFYLGSILILAIFSCLLGIEPNRKRSSMYFVPIVIMMMLLGYFFIYVLTPQDLVWHLDASLRRLFLHLWPSMIFFVFLFLNFDPAYFSRKLN